MIHLRSTLIMLLALTTAWTAHAADQPLDPAAQALKMKLLAAKDHPELQTDLSLQLAWAYISANQFELAESVSKDLRNKKTLSPQQQIEILKVSAQLKELKGDLNVAESDIEQASELTAKIAGDPTELLFEKFWILVNAGQNYKACEIAKNASGSKPHPATFAGCAKYPQLYETFRSYFTNLKAFDAGSSRHRVQRYREMLGFTFNDHACEAVIPLNDPTIADDDLQIQYLQLSAECAKMDHQLSTAKGFLAQAMEIATHNTKLIVRRRDLLISQGAAATDDGHYAEAISAFEKALPLTDETKGRKAEVLLKLAKTETESGDLQKAARTLDDVELLKTSFTDDEKERFVLQKSDVLARSDKKDASCDLYSSVDTHDFELNRKKAECAVRSKNFSDAVSFYELALKTPSSDSKKMDDVTLDYISALSNQALRSDNGKPHYHWETLKKVGKLEKANHLAVIENTFGVLLNEQLTLMRLKSPAEVKKLLKLNGLKREDFPELYERFWADYYLKADKPELAKQVVSESKSADPDPLITTAIEENIAAKQGDLLPMLTSFITAKHEVGDRWFSYLQWPLSQMVYDKVLPGKLNANFETVVQAAKLAMPEYTSPLESALALKYVHDKKFAEAKKHALIAKEYQASHPQKDPPHPDWPDTLLGMAEIGEGHGEEGVVHLKAAIEMNPHCMPSLMTIAKYYCDQKDYESGKSYYLRLIAAADEDLDDVAVNQYAVLNSTNGYVDLGKCAAALGHESDAVHYLNRGLERADAGQTVEIKDSLAKLKARKSLAPVTTEMRLN